MMHVRSCYGKSGDLSDALDKATGQVADMLNSKRGDLINLAQSVVTIGSQYVVVMTLVLETDDLVAEV
jgi:hypothetical protein